MHKKFIVLLGKLLYQLSEIQEEIGKQTSSSELFHKRLKTIKKILEQQTELFNGNKIKGRIVSISKDYVRPIVRGKEKKE